MSILKATLSTVTSSTFSEVIVFYRDCDFRGSTVYPHHTSNVYRTMTPAQSTKQDLWHRGLFEAFHEMHTVRDFRSVLCVDVWDRMGEYAVEVVK